MWRPHCFISWERNMGRDKRFVHVVCWSYAFQIYTKEVAATLRFCSVNILHMKLWIRVLNSLLQQPLESHTLARGKEASLTHLWPLTLTNFHMVLSCWYRHLIFFLAIYFLYRWNDFGFKNLSRKYDFDMFLK